MKSGILLRLALILCGLLTLTSAAQAQNRYTFVSMTGNDANNCLSATTACRTFQRAHDVVSDGGTVVARDSGGYGPITITKSVTITGEGVMAGITVNGNNAIGVNINTPGVVVRLRYLHIQGINTSGESFGISYTNGAGVHVEHCTTSGFSSAFSGGIFINTPGRLFVSDSVSRNNYIGIYVGFGTGVDAGPFGQATIERTLLELNSDSGLAAYGGKTTIRKSRSAGNSIYGVFAVGTGVEISVDDCNISGNNTGIAAQATAIVRVANSLLANNAGAAALPASAGQILTRIPATNSLVGNGTNGTFSGSYTAQ